MTDDPEFGTDSLSPYLRGQDVNRWQVGSRACGCWPLRSSVNYAWPWSRPGDDAETVFAETYPASTPT